MKIFNGILLQDNSPPISFLLFCKHKNQNIMKPIFLAFSVTLSFISAQAQLSKNNWLVGGAGSFYSYNENYNSPSTNFTAKYTNIGIYGSIGYFIADKLTLGLRPTFSSVKGEVINGGSTNSYQLAGGPFVRYYFLEPERPFNLLADMSYQLGINKYLGALHEKGKYNTFSLMAGPEIFFNTTVGIEILFGYTKKITSIEGTPGEFNSNKKGLQIAIGFQFHLEKD
ncbi:MAG: hypothetical protein HZB42_03815 [Sphingobacteriales bacterium]|nr:hypothetical protein [Sphingobacteriales bacterium]